MKSRSSYSSRRTGMRATLGHSFWNCIYFFRDLHLNSIRSCLHAINFGNGLQEYCQKEAFRFLTLSGFFDPPVLIKEKEAFWLSVQALCNPCTISFLNMTSILLFLQNEVFFLTDVSRLRCIGVVSGLFSRRRAEGWQALQRFKSTLCCRANN